jgi:hypothetical protein
MRADVGARSRRTSAINAIVAFDREASVSSRGRLLLRHVRTGRSGNKSKVRESYSLDIP